MSLKDDLTEIHGVGEAKADEIMTVFEQHGESGTPPEVRDNLEAAYDYHNDEQYQYVGKFLRRAVENL